MTPHQPTLRIRAARTHNLRNVDIDLPLNQLIVITGVSGSGKSSLAFDTIFSEGQRRYLENLSTSTRGLLQQLPHADVDEITGLPPTVSVDQRVSLAPPRSTLAVTTEIYDYLRLLYARAGTVHCVQCDRPVGHQTVDEIVARILQLPHRSKLMVLAPLVRGRRGSHQDVLQKIARNGFVRARVDGQLVDVAEADPPDPRAEHTIDAVIDRLILKPEIESRLRESVELAVRESDGACVISVQQGTDWSDAFFSTRLSCAACGISYPVPEPRTFSFHSAWGACPACEGFGIQGVADDTDDVTVFRRIACPECQGSRLQPFARKIRFQGLAIHEFTAHNVDAAVQQVSTWQQQLNDSPGPEAQVAARTLPDVLNRLQCLRKVGLGYLTLDRPTRTLSGGEYQRARLAACLGMNLHGACYVLDEPTTGLHPRDTEHLISVLTEIRDSGATVIVVEHDMAVMQAADILVDLGPHAGAEGGRLMYCGPPDSAHTADSPTGRLFQRLRQKDHGEHPSGGQASENSRTPASHENDSTETNRPVQQTLFSGADEPPAGKLVIKNARQHNLCNVTVTIPLNKLVCVTGVSGSGKTTLVMETLLPMAQAVLAEADVTAAAADFACDAVEGVEFLNRVIAVDQRPLGKSSRSCLATYSGLWNHIRRLLSRTREARARGFSSRRFSFNAGDGRCQKCRGTGLLDLQMSFLPNVQVTCPECEGKRFNRATLRVRFRDHNAADILQMRVDEAIGFFSEFQDIAAVLGTFRDVGLGYLSLGQPASTFSGGEAQRVRLAKELAATTTAPTLFVLDEPTTGLHAADVDHLLLLLRRLVDAGHSVIVIEHNTDVMTKADWIIDVGPESGAMGGRVVAEGPPQEIADVPESLTGRFLRR